jgi:phosphoribosylglycinamide formyltransferase-1
VSRQRVAILISGGGSNMVALARDMEDAGHPATPCLVLSNLAGAGGLERAREMGIEAAGIDHRGFETRHEFEAAMQDRQPIHLSISITRANFVMIIPLMPTW